MKKYISKRVLFVNLFFQLIFWIIILCISAGLFHAPFKTIYYLKDFNNINQFNYIELIPIFITDFISLIMLLFMGGIYYHFSSNSLENFKTILYQDFNNTFYELKSILRKYTIITFINCIFIFFNDTDFILIILNISLILFVLKPRIIPNRGLRYLTFGSISFLMFIDTPKDFYLIFLYLLILVPFNILITQDNKKSIYFPILSLSFFLSIFIMDYNISFVDFKIAFTILLFTIILALQLTPLIYLFLYLLKVSLNYIKKLPVAEYTAASFAKQNRANETILIFLTQKCKPFKHIPTKKIEEILNKYNYSLDKRSSFEEFLFKLNLSPDDTDEILHFYNVTPLPYKEIKISKTENVKFRNNNNLFISVGVLIVLIILYVITISLFELDFTKLFLTISFIFIFIRLLLRSIEICFAFYNDIKPNIKIKRTNLLGSERITLALKSILEVIILSTSIYLISDVLKNYSAFNYYEFTNSLIDSFFKAIAIAFFNISYNYSVKNLFFSIESLIAMTHLLQIISSVTLISISIANYINLPKQNIDYELIVRDHQYYLYKRIHSTNKYSPKTTKEITYGNTIDDLLTNVGILWDNDKISYLELEEIHEFLNIVYFKH